MLKNIKNTFMLLLCLCVLTCSLSGCLTKIHPHDMTTKQMSELEQGKRYFVTGYYKHALYLLLPLACAGNCEAEYAIGYMYYYGYGVVQDTTVGAIWIRLAANQGYAPALHALAMIAKNETDVSPVRQKDILQPCNSCAH